MLIGFGNMLKNTLPIQRILSAFRFATYCNTKHGLLRCKTRPFERQYTAFCGYYTIVRLYGYEALVSCSLGINRITL